MTRATVAACARTGSEGGSYGSRALGSGGAPVLATVDGGQCRRRGRRHGDGGRRTPSGLGGRSWVLPQMVVPLAPASPGGSPRIVPLLVRRDLLCPRLAPGDGPASALLTHPWVFGRLGRGEKVGAGGLRLLGSAGLVHHARSVPQATPRRPAAVRRTTCHPIERRRTTRWHCGGRRTRSIQAWPGTRDNEPPAYRIEWPTRPLRFPLREVRLPPRHLVRPVAQGRAVQGCFPMGLPTMIVSLEAIFLSTFVMSSQTVPT
jgi:hypothetical protein